MSGNIDLTLLLRPQKTNRTAWYVSLKVWHSPNRLPQYRVQLLHYWEQSVRQRPGPCAGCLKRAIRFSPRCWQGKHWPLTFLALIKAIYTYPWIWRRDVSLVALDSTHESLVCIPLFKSELQASWAPPHRFYPRLAGEVRSAAESQSFLSSVIARFKWLCSYIHLCLFELPLFIFICLWQSHFVPWSIL